MQPVHLALPDYSQYINQLPEEKSNQTQELNFGTCIDVESIENLLIKNEKKLQIHKALHLFNEPYKEVFTLSVFGELKNWEIAEIFGKTESRVKVTCYKAKGADS